MHTPDLEPLSCDLLWLAGAREQTRARTIPLSIPSRGSWDTRRRNGGETWKVHGGTMKR